MFFVKALVVAVVVVSVTYDSLFSLFLGTL